MEEKYFLAQIRRTNGVYDQGVAVKNSLADAKQSFHAYLGAYGYGRDANTDYVAAYIVDMRGARLDFAVDDRIPLPEPPETEE